MGNIENFIERLHICVIGFARTWAPSLRNLADRLSRPGALSVFIFFNNLSIVSCLAIENVNLFGSKSKIC